MRGQIRLSGYFRCLFKLSIAWIFALVSLNSCVSFTPPDYNYHLRLWEKAFVDANAQLARNNLTEATKLCQEALLESEQLGSNDIRNALTLTEIAKLYALQNKIAEAISACAHARDILSAFWRQPSYSYNAGEQLANTLTQLSELHLQNQNEAESMAAIKEAVEIYDTLWKKKNNKLLGQHFAKALCQQAIIYEKEANHKTSRDLFERALAINTWSGGTSDSTDLIRQGLNLSTKSINETTSTRTNSFTSDTQRTPPASDLWFQFLKEGDSLESQGKLDQAMKMYAMSLKSAESTGTDNDGALESLRQLERLSSKMQKLDETQAYKAQEINLLAKQYGENHPALIKPLYELATMKACARANWDLAAIPLLERIAQIAQQIGDPVALDTGMRSMQLATACLLQHKDYQGAQRYALSAYEFAKRTETGRSTWAQVLELNNLVDIYFLLKQPEKAMPLLQEIEQISKTPEAARHAQLACWLSQVAGSCANNEQPAFAKTFANLAQAILTNAEKSSSFANEAIYKQQTLANLESLRRIQQGGTASNAQALEKQVEKLAAAGKEDQAESLLQKAGRQNMASASDNSCLAHAYLQLALSSRSKGEQEKAIKFLDKSLSFCQEADQSADWIAAYSHEFLSELYDKQNDRKKAIEHLKQAVSLRKKIINEAPIVKMSAQGIAEHRAVLEKDQLFMQSLTKEGLK